MPVLVVFLLSLFLCTEAFAVQVTDATGASVTVHNARRIVPLYAAFTDILDALGALDLVVARTKADRKCPNLPAVGTHMRPSLERIMALKPDLVLQLHGRAEAHDQTDFLRRFGIPVLELELSSFEDLWLATRRIGQAIGHPERAELCVANWQKRLAQSTEKRGLRVVYEVRYPNLLVAGGGNIVSDIIRCAGCENAVTSPKKFVRLSDEALFALNPDVYIIQTGPMNPDPVPLSERPGWGALRVAQGKVITVQEDLFSRPGPGALDACFLLREGLGR